MENPNRTNKSITLETKSQQQKSHQRNKHLDSPYCNILWIILKIDERGSQTNGPNDKEIDYDVQSVTPKRGHRQCHEKKEKEDSPALRILEEYTNKGKERSITATINIENKNGEKNNSMATSSGMLGRLHKRWPRHSKEGETSRKKYIFFLSRGIILWIELPWLENPTNTYAWHTETLDSFFYLIRSHQQYIPSSPLEIEPATTDCRAETLQLSQQSISHTSDAK